MSNLPDHGQSSVRKFNRQTKQERKKRKYKIAHESGRSLKTRWAKTVERAQKLKKK